MGSIGNEIARQRQIAGMTQRELAEKLQMTPQQLSQYETGARTPRYSTLKRIAAAIGCNIGDGGNLYGSIPSIFCHIFRVFCRFNSTVSRVFFCF